MLARYKYLGSCKTGTINKELSAKVYRLIPINFKFIQSPQLVQEVGFLSCMVSNIMFCFSMSNQKFYFILCWNGIK